MHARRDAVISKHLRTEVYAAEAFALLRLVCKISKRECGLIHQSFKHEHMADGTRKRHRLAPDSAQPAPPLFDPNAIGRAQLAQPRRSQPCPPATALHSPCYAAPARPVAPTL